LNGVKHVNIKIINNSISYFGLFIWIADDGTKKGKSNVIISTNCFKEEDIKSVREILKDKFKILTSTHAVHDNEFVLYF
jgi:hypothetical protein